METQPYKHKREDIDHFIYTFQNLTKKTFYFLKKIVNYLNQSYPEVFTIADAKRGDIGNTSKMYANAFLKELNFDSITVSPYMGYDSVEPFLSIEDKLVFLLALTSNIGSNDFQELNLDNNNKLYQKEESQS